MITVVPPSCDEFDGLISAALVENNDSRAGLRESLLWRKYVRCPVANIQSARKRIRSNARKEMRNKIRKSKVRTAVREARKALDDNNVPAARVAVQRAASQLDKAAVNGVIHSNNAARRKSNLMQRLSALEMLD